VPQNFTPADANTASHDATAAFTALGIGAHSVALRVTDNEGGTDTEFTTVTVKAADDPSCNATPVCPAPQSMVLPGPYNTPLPDGMLVAVTPAGVTDADGDPLTYTATTITQDEPRKAAFDATLNPIQVRNWRSFDPRRPAAGQTGRVYEITYRATDPSGAFCTGVIKVCVPRVGGACIDEGQTVSSTP
jgi:hypothetical protein